MYSVSVYKWIPVNLHLNSGYIYIYIFSILLYILYISTNVVYFVKVILY
jgi:hypothetical protein